ncbi:hypothetical protein [Oryza sativa Japonica Group]|uniref:Uncharacterized protein n=1 Tax=Oryza sativa subsp. japonica TaxID=39947 RepID=Q5QLI0_ORYSJ|nr:hypothetical protein [Oryza sativa Japonica Group]BAD73741.1 hypothetical protein [Oryza sativa Japonica Group]
MVRTAAGRVEQGIGCCGAELAAEAGGRLVLPYLFVTVHLVILVIWKLSDHKHFQVQQQLKDPWPHPHPVVPVAAVLPAAAEYAPSLIVKPKEEFNAAAVVYGGGGMPEHEASTAASYTSYERRSLAPPPQEHSILEWEISLPLPGVAATAVEREYRER